MDIKVSGTKVDDLDVICKRGNIPCDKERNLVDWMFFREYYLFLGAPKKVSKNLNKETRKGADKSIDCVELNDKYKIEYMKDIKTELSKALSRHGTGIEDIRFRDGLFDDSVENEDFLVIISKMIQNEIKLLNEPRAGCFFYVKEDFISMQELIEDMVRNEVVPLESKLGKQITDLELDMECLIRYCLLSARIPEDVPKEHAMQEKYVRQLVDIKLNALEMLIQDAEDAVNTRDVLDLMNKFEAADILAFEIRAAINGEELEESLQKKDLKKYTKDELKEY